MNDISLSAMLTEALALATNAKMLYQEHAAKAKELKEATSGWELNNGYRSMSDGCGNNASKCIDLQEVLVRVASICSLAKANNPEFISHIRQNLTTAKWYFSKATA